MDGTAQGKGNDIFPSLKLDKSYGFSDDPEKTEKDAFNQIPEIILHRTIAGSILMDTNYKLYLTESIIDAGKGVNDDSSNSFAVTSATKPAEESAEEPAEEPAKTWAAPTQVNSITVLGRMQVESISGQGGIWVHQLEVLNNQQGCLKFSYFSGKGDRLPQNHACVTGTEAKLRFVSEIFGQPAYGQLHASTDRQILEQGPNDDAMGAFGFLLEAHKWRNLQMQYLAPNLFRQYPPLESCQQLIFSVCGMALPILDLLHPFP